ncbi:hypothetical protein A3A79_04815 [Candidatus Gottesmanbacteria bacterium RIFCSPLOWO2_01_FULL_43_11b]|uniref:Polysaccharide biosynthesis protein C-terminal domain-containing protein n=1 Tax=Candidatus Gottesmanbacteria bacterium RIFCSPLOWO2_01_FULL_43_11b TaxID=1798392 RepID=A0A1F6AJP3_9BACT|nr:MAG: hypothetical protein A3A79_04815 [Candidatus Gottesmanbacteria bacterium RIFCSPLOWO2_01_FULL_43_11b]
MVGGHGFANIGAYFYHLFMGRLLIPSDYGALQSLISLSNILSVPTVTLNTVVAKFVSTYVGKGEKEMISSLYYQLRKFLFIFLIIGGALFLLFSNPIMKFLHLENWVNVLILDLALFLGLINFLNRATLQGLSLFVPLTITQFIEAFGKLIFGVVAVLAGLRVPGAFGAFVLVVFISYGYMVTVLHKKLGKPSYRPLPIRAMGRYAIPSALMTIGVTALYNTDVILVRHFLSAYEAGLYAALSVLGKIIFFGTAPVVTTMFPLVSEAHARGERYHRIFLLSLMFLVAIAGSVTLLFTILPTFMMKLLIGSQYLDAAVYLAPFSLFLSLCAVIYLFVNFFLSIHRTRAVYVVVAGAIVQAVALSLFHPDISTVITISLSVTTLLTVILSFYYISVARS